MNDVVGGSTPADVNIINATLASALKLPTEGPTPQAPAQPVPQAQPQAAPAQPRQMQLPGQSIPNVSQAPVDALKSVELPFDVPTEHPKAPEPAQPEVDPDEADLPETPAAENFKKLRGIVKETRATKRQLEAELTETKTRLEQYQKGEVVPDIIVAKDQRIAQLEPYEKIVNLKMSPEYQESFVLPAQSLRTSLEKLGEDYAIPAEYMHQAVGITNRKELNQFLSNIGLDDVGALEAKRLIGDLHTLGEKAQEADKQPGETLQALRAEFKQKEQERAQERATVFDVTARESWTKALAKTKAEGAYPELILHPTDPEYNQKVVEPIQARAATQYGALVKKLAENGLKHLPPELADGLARMVLLSIGGALTLEAKMKAEQRAERVLDNTKRTGSYIRPSMGTTNGAGHSTKAPNSAGPRTPQDAAKAGAAFFNR